MAIDYSCNFDDGTFHATRGGKRILAIKLDELNQHSPAFDKTLFRQLCTALTTAYEEGRVAENERIQRVVQANF